MTPETYSFSGDATTFLGLVGVTSALLITVVAFRRFFNSPYNIRYVKKNDSPSSSGGTDSSAGI
jgi:hypothetical protein